MTQKSKANIGDEIKSHFTKTQSWLAKKIGMSNGQLSKKLNNKAGWSQKELDAINKILGTSFKL